MSEEEKEKKMRELYEQYKKSRDSELDKFWKNSMYVWTFLGLCFTAYGIMIFKYVDSEFNNFKQQLAIAVICTFGFLLSMVWKRMAQGLKAWYEVFEIAIWDLESQHNVFNFPPNYNIGNYWYVDENKASKPFSPSAIVVSIGWYMIVFWIVAFVINFTLFYVDSYSCEVIFSINDSFVQLKTNMSNNHNTTIINEQLKNLTEQLKIIESQIDLRQRITFGILCLLLVGAGIFACFYGKKSLISSVLRTQKYEDKFVEIKKQLLEQDVPYLYLEVKKRKNNKDIIRIVFEKKYKQDKRITEIVSNIKNHNQSSFEVKDEYIEKKYNIN